MRIKKGYRQYWRYILLAWTVCSPCIPITTFAVSFTNTASYKAYFTPINDCTTQIVEAIDSAHKSIYMHAYSLTSEPIVEALIRAHHRKVPVNIIIDKSNLSDGAKVKIFAKQAKISPFISPHKKRAVESKAQFLAKRGVSIWVDNLSGLAHNKVIIIDQEKVITGSFNFSHAAQHRNRENVLIISDKNLSNLYLQNWHRCQKKSTLLQYKQSKPKYSSSQTKSAARTKNIFMGLVTCIAIGTLIALR